METVRAEERFLSRSDGTQNILSTKLLGPYLMDSALIRNRPVSPLHGLHLALAFPSDLTQNLKQFMTLK